MRRIPFTPRTTLHEKAKAVGFDFVTMDGIVYWDESAYYRFTLRQIEDDLEDPSAELHALCLELVDRVVRDERLMERLAIPRSAWDLIAGSWRRSDPSLYGRFDLAYDGTGPAKLLEYNADTPTALFEAAVFQWGWLEDAIADRILPAGSDQFNSIHDVLIARLAELAQRWPTLHLTCMAGSIEDRGLIAYVGECATRAGMAPRHLELSDIGTTGRGPFVDLQNAPIELLFKLYPWEWMFEDDFARSPSMSQTRFVEPPWKAILSNKAMLALLWEMAPGHPNLLACFFEHDPACGRLTERHARKPFHSREGHNVTLVRDNRVVCAADGPYGSGPCVLQELVDIAPFAGNVPVVGSWIVGGRACGIGLREDKGPITSNASRFVPHAIID